ncbi:MAG TPA: hypothetical protein VMM76_26805 [Pirellulaceae bacterium]|nr:hypothetical protein [Pirellulaceae bacterium]
MHGVARASLLTGHHPHAIQSMRMEGQYPGSVYDPWQCPFWPAVFRRHGYQTAHIGNRGTYANQNAEPPASMFGPREGKPSYLERRPTDFQSSCRCGWMSN